MPAWVKWIEGSERVAARVISTRNVSVHAESRFQRRFREPISNIRSKCPRFDACRTEGAELPHALKVKVPSGPFSSGGLKNPRPQGVAHLLGCASFERRFFTIQTQVVHVQGMFVRQAPCGVHAPKTNGVVGRVVEKSELIQVGTHRKSVDLPGIDFALNHETVEAEPHVRTFANINQAAGAVVHLLSTDSELDPVPITRCAQLQERRLEVELLFIDGSRPPDAERIQRTL